jgi:glycosyltransferase involved in cell wall biosynthesis
MNLGGDGNSKDGVHSSTAEPTRGGGVVDTPLVSVCISAYNVERFLAESLGSVLAQTYRNIEVILIDNGSADRTYEVAQSLANDRVQCFRVPQNLGGYQAMNKVVSMAKGEFVAVYHSDDYYEPDIVAKEVAYLQSHPQVGAVFCLAHFMDQRRTIFGGSKLPREFVGKESLGYEEVFRFILRNKNVIFICPTFMVRRAVLEVVGRFDPETYDIASDLEMWLRIARRFPVAILNERLMRYRVGDHQWTSRYRRLRTEPERWFQVMDDYLAKDGWLSKLRREDLVEYDFHRCDDATYRAANAVRSGDTVLARKLLEHRYPWRTLANGLKRRKVRLIVLRALIMLGLSAKAPQALARILAHIGP